MKKLIYPLLFLIIGLVCYSLFYNAKSHVEVVKVASELEVKTDSLTTTVKVLHKERDSAFTKINLLDSTITSKDLLLDRQNSDLVSLKKNITTLKKNGPIIIHDTIYITESKNFWGKKKTKIEKTSTIDTLEIEENVTTDSIK